MKPNKKEIPFYKSPEIVSLIVFITMYIVIRIVEKCFIPRIPSFFLCEIKSLCRLGPIIFPIIFGITYYSNKDNKQYYISDKDLKDRIFMKK